MLISLRLQPSQGPAPEDAFSLLRECHQRIRTFTAMGQRLARANDASPGEVTEAASRLEHYFTVGLPKHVADEDHSLAPRLRALEQSSDVRSALEVMESQHRSLEVLLERLVPWWRELKDAPERLASLALDLEEYSDRLAVEMAAHLLLEETVLFPAGETRLSAESMASLGMEMRARRGVAP